MKKIILLLITVSFLALLSFSGNYLYKLNKSFDLFAEILEFISNDYVLETDPEILVKHGINGMLASLDPYTKYYDSEDRNQLELFTDGTYTGIGISVATFDSMLTISDIKYKGPAYNAGFKIGDVIYSIDSVEVINLHPDEIRQFIDYQEGRNFSYRVIRNNDTLELNVIQEKIQVDDIPFSFVSDDKILYIKMDYFSRNTPSQFRDILYDNNNLNGCIIDLRDNPGGLLYSSVEICETVLPNNSLVVSTKGKSVNETYSTNREPILDSVPLVVIINENSASASEILAGAIQDNDRGVIIGQKSFGKGLVQSILNLSYDSDLKITTAKYYTPSGRCIQKLTFADEYTGRVIEDTVKKSYYTKNNRVVTEANGIVPDSIIKYNDSSEILKYLDKDNIIFNFATDFCNKMKEPVKRLKDSNMVFDEFMRYLNKNDFRYNENYISDLDSLRNYIIQTGYNNDLAETIDMLKNELSNNKEVVKKHKTLLLEEIRIEVLRRFYSTNEKYLYYLENDNFYHSAKEIILSGKYNKFLKLN
jgi:carboxyl-terminal processing protease